MDHKKIATEVLQSISAAQVAEYRCIPYERSSGMLRCYGIEGCDYSQVIPEMNVIFGVSIEIEYIAAEEFNSLVGRYYRGERSAEKHSSNVTGAGPEFLMKLIKEAYDLYASDIHFELYEDRCRIRLRIDGKLVERYVVEKTNYATLINQIKILANLDISEKRLPQDGRIGYKRGDMSFDVRVSAVPTIYGEKAVLRLLTRHAELLDINRLGFSERQLADYIRAVSSPHGLILISGPTGSGKSTTLYATLRLLNNENINILTIEDPVEYTIDGINQVQLKEDIGLTFGSTLRTFLRQDPDIIMLGEIRDSDTAQMAVRSSLTGHLIFSTIHTNSAWGSVARMTDMGLNPYLISNTLIMCMAQRLVRTLCPECKKRIEPDQKIAKTIAGLDCSEVFAPVGCPSCYYSGYKGRRAIYEVVPVGAELSEMIRSGENNIERYMESEGVVSLSYSASKLFASGETSLEEILPIISANN